jgi:trans-aconitate methyltransferase
MDMMNNIEWVCKIAKDDIKPMADSWNAAYYNKHSQIQYDLGMSIINQLYFKGTESVLDIGCGDGKLTAEIAKRVPRGHIVGVDVSPSMITESAKRFKHFKNMSFALADATTFFTDKRFDYVVSFSTFHWIKDKATTLKHIFNMLKPGGKLAILMRHQESQGRALVFESATWKPILEALGEKRFYCDQEIMRQLLSQTGFNNIHLQENMVEIPFAHKQEMFDWVKGAVPAATGLQGKMAEQFAWDLAESVCKNRDIRTGKYIERVPFLYITAQR